VFTLDGDGLVSVRIEEKYSAVLFKLSLSDDGRVD
jgi:hypothetical protein